MEYHEQTTHDRLVYRDEEERAKARQVGLWKDPKRVLP
jgi:endonuclease YncB( thermonuclease family)